MSVFCDMNEDNKIVSGSSWHTLLTQLGRAYHKVFKDKKNKKIHYRFQNFHLFCMQNHPSSREVEQQEIFVA